MDYAISNERESMPLNSVRQLTIKQMEILGFIRNSIERNQRPPSYREIMERFSFRSSNSVTGHLTALVRKGKIELTDGDARGIKLKGVKVSITDTT